MTPAAEVNFLVDSWTTTPKATTAGSSMGFEDNICEDTLSSQSTYKINSGCPYYKASIAPNPKLLNDFAPSKEQFIRSSTMSTTTLILCQIILKYMI